VYNLRKHANSLIAKGSSPAPTPSLEQQMGMVHKVEDSNASRSISLEAVVETTTQPADISLTVSQPAQSANSRSQQAIPSASSGSYESPSAKLPPTSSHSEGN
jgi:hypothetical protein